MKKRVLLLSFLSASILGFSQVNNALSFDGSDDAVAIANQPLKDATDFTIEAQILNENANPNEDVFMQFYDATDTRFELRFDNGKLSVYSEKLGIQPNSTFTVPVGTYFHLALVKTGTTTKLYADGTEVLSFNGQYSLGSGLQLGRYFGDLTYSFKGKMDEFRMWNVAKSIADIKAEPKCGLVGNETNLVGYWNFNEGVAGANNANYISLTDKSSSNKNGVLSNFALQGTSSNWVSSTTGCVEPTSSSNALSFDGSDDQVAIANQPLKNATSFTIEAFVMNENTNAVADVFMQFYDANDTRFEIRINSGKLAVYSQVLNIEPSSTFSVPVGKFFHFALVKDGATTYLYANGQQVLFFQGNYSLGDGLRLGRYFASNTNSFKGKLDELRMWNVAKSLSQLNAEPNCGLVGNEANLVGYWNFDQGLAEGSNTGITTLTDKSSSSANGTLSNFTLSGTSSNWVTSTACTDVITGVENIDLVNSVKIFPNPATNWIEIQGAENNSVVEIYSVAGQLVLSQELNGRISLPATLDAGMYIVNVKGSKTSKHMIVKQ